jgi:hypothetical protein
VLKLRCIHCPVLKNLYGSVLITVLCNASYTEIFDFIFKETISDHSKTFSPDCARDLIDSFLEEMELRNKRTDSTFHGKDNTV